VSLSPPFYRNLATRCLGYISWGYHTSQSCWGNLQYPFAFQKISQLFIIVGLSLHFQYSGHIVNVVSYQYRSPFLCSAQAFLVTTTVSTRFSFFAMNATYICVGCTSIHKPPSRSFPLAVLFFQIDWNESVPEIL
jgi:hypothetical protein